MLTATQTNLTAELESLSPKELARLVKKLASRKHRETEQAYWTTLDTLEEQADEMGEVAYSDAVDDLDESLGAERGDWEELAGAMQSFISDRW